MAVVRLVVVTSNTAKNRGHSGVAVVPAKVMFDFICRPVGGTLRTSDETAHSGWFPKGEVMEMIGPESLRERYRAYLEFDGRVRYLAYVTRPEYALREKRFI